MEFDINHLYQIYPYVWMLIVTIFSFSAISWYRTVNFDLPLAEQKRPDNAGMALCLFFSFLVGLRPMGIKAWQWGDSDMYQYSYDQMLGDTFEFSWSTSNRIWDNLLNYWACNSIDITYLMLICSAIYFGATYMACKKWFPHDTTVAYLAFLGAFSSYNFALNGVKAGVAAALFLVAIAYYEERWISVLFMLLSLGFHHSMTVPIAAYVLTLFFKDPKYYFYGWAFCLLMAILHIGFFSRLFMGVSSDVAAENYLAATGQGEGEYVRGFRPDFVLYSAVPVWMGWRLVMREGRQMSKMYLTLLYMYLTTNAVWMLCMYASFTNRIAYLSWFMYPFVLLYPFLKEDLSGSPTLFRKAQYDFMTMVFKYHLYFTLFMNLIFYKFIHPTGGEAV